MKKEYDFTGARRGRHHRKGARVRLPVPSTVSVTFKISPRVHAALIALRDTGFFGDGCDSASVAKELMCHALLDPKIKAFWQEALSKPKRRKGKA